MQRVSDILSHIPMAANEQSIALSPLDPVTHQRAQRMHQAARPASTNPTADTTLAFFNPDH